MLLLVLDGVLEDDESSSKELSFSYFSKSPNIADVLVLCFFFTTLDGSPKGLHFFRSNFIFNWLLLGLEQVHSSFRLRGLRRRDIKFGFGRDGLVAVARCPFSEEALREGEHDLDEDDLLLSDFF